MTGISEIFLQKSATDAGFDIPADKDAPLGWLRCRSCRFSLTAWLRSEPSGAVIALSHTDVFDTLSKEFPHAAQVRDGLPQSAIGAILASSTDEVHALLARSVQLEQSLPDRIADAFVSQTKNMPQETETERLAVQRIGQDMLREGLLNYWNGMCAVTNLALPEVLRASHIKPWSKCESAEERLNAFNALLLAAHLDALFDRGFITFADDGNMEMSPKLTIEQRRQLCLSDGMKLTRIAHEHCKYLDYHRKHVFQTSETSSIARGLR